MVAVTAVTPVAGMPLVTVVCGVVLVPTAASVLGVCVSLTLVDGSVAGFARAVLGSAGAVLAVVVRVSRCGGVGRMPW